MSAPRSLLGSLLFVQVCLLAGLAGILCFRHPWPGLTMLGLVWLGDLPRSAAWRHSLLLGLFFLLAFCYTGLRAPTPPPAPDWLDQAVAVRTGPSREYQVPQALRLVGDIADVELLAGGRTRILLRNARPADAPGEAPYGGDIAWVLREAPFIPTPGGRIEGTLRLARVRGFINPGSWDSGEYWRNRGVWFRAWSSGKLAPRLLDEDKAGAANLWRRDLLQRFRQALPGLAASSGLADPSPDQSGVRGQRPTPGASVLPALIFNDRSFISAGVTDLFARATLSHSLALSGLHLGFALLAGAALARLACALRPTLCLALPRMRLALLLAVPLALAYLWLGQAPYSLIRAMGMLLFSAVLVFLKRPNALFDGLFAALACILLYNPFAFFDLGLQLSALCIICLALCLPPLSRLALRLVPGQGRAARFGRAAGLLLGASLCIQLVLLPLTAKAFGVTGLFFVLNVLWIPLLSVLVLPLAFLGLLATALHLPELAGVLLQAASLPCDALIRLLHCMAGHNLLPAPVLPRPHWASMAGYWLLLIVLPRLRPAAWRPSALLPACMACVALALLLGPPLYALHEQKRGMVRLSVLDVGQGQAALIQWSGIGPDKAAGRVMVDGGGFSSPDFDVGKAVVGPVLTDQALPRLDAVIATHADVDHFSGLLHLLESFQVRRYYGNDDLAPPRLAEREARALAERGLVRERLRAGDRVELGPDLHLEVLWPAERYGPARGNSASLVLRLVWQGRGLAMLCGDVEIPGMQAMLAARPPESLRADVLLLPHHGSAKNCLPEFYQAVSPGLALASCGHANRWGFPSALVRETLAGQGIALDTTAESGRIDVEWEATPGRPPWPLHQDRSVQCRP